MSTKRVLIIDDDLGIRRIVQISLKAIAGWEVFLADSGQQGLKMAEQEKPDAILLDVMMPGMDGIDTYAKIQSNPDLKSIPTILLTAKAQVSEHSKFTNLGVAGIITKPFKAPDLVQQMCSILQWN